MSLRPEGSQSLRLKELQGLRPEGNFVSAPEYFESEERREKQFVWQLRKQRGMKRGVEAHAEDTCLHPRARKLFDDYLVLV